MGATGAAAGGLGASEGEGPSPSQMLLHMVLVSSPRWHGDKPDGTSRFHHGGKEAPRTRILPDLLKVVATARTRLEARVSQLRHGAADPNRPDWRLGGQISGLAISGIKALTRSRDHGMIDSPRGRPLGPASRWLTDTTPEKWDETHPPSEPISKI